MILKTSMLGQVYEFKDVKDVLAKASEKKSGDELAGVAAESKLQRIAAKEVLGQLTVGDLRENPVVPYEEDSVTRIIQDDIDEEVYREIKGKTIQEMREWILDDTTDSDKIMRASRGLTSEAIAAISKIMGNMDLILAGSKMHITATCNTTIGTENVLAARLQPNHPVDDVEGVTASTLEGLSYGSGDAVIGLNPAIDTVDSTLAIWKTLGDIRDKYQIPTQTCVLSHVTTQMEALRSGQGSADLCFQSIAGSEAALSAFGVTTEMLEEAEALFKEKGHAKGPNVMYFETGQGSELSSSAAFGADQQTMECRCYGLARHYHPFLVNTVVGFMGPEYIYDTKQLTRAALEDVFCGHLHGLPMGCDVCYTNHMPTDQNDSETILTLLGTAGEYVNRLKKVSDKVSDKLMIIPRVYTNKPRTTGDGYKGMLHQPDPDKAPDLLAGIIAIRKMHIRVLQETGLSSADEMLYPENRSYLDDVLSYEAIGARSVENQQHRLTASGMDIPVGMKNPTSGDLSVMLNSVIAAQHPHHFIYRGCDVETSGNPLAHTILRGGVDKYGQTIPNYHYEDLMRLYDLYSKKDLQNPAVIVDVNHSNSGKQYKEQIRIVSEVLHSRNYNPDVRKLVKGVMIESYLLEGRQDISDHMTPGCSITDPCLGWEDTERLLYDIAEKC